MPDRRAHPRLPLPLPVTFVVDGDTRVGVAENLSAGGAALRLGGKLEVGSELDEISFELPESGGSKKCRVTTAAEVVYCEARTPVEGEQEYQAGIRFVELQEKAFDRIQESVFQSFTRGRPSAAEIPRDRRRVNITETISVRFDRFDEFVNEASENISASGMFIRSSKPSPPGSVFSFSFQLGDDFALVEGRGEVVWTRKKSLDARHPAGMGVRFIELDDRSRNVILSLVEKATQRDSGDGAAAGPELGSPKPSEVEVAASTSQEIGESADITVTGTDADLGAGADPETLRRELAKRSEAYEARIETLEDRVAALTSGQRNGAEVSQADLDALLEDRVEELQTFHERELNNLLEKLEAADRKREELADEVRFQSSEVEARRRKTGALENRLSAAEQALHESEIEREQQSAQLRDSIEARSELERKLEELTEGQEAARRANLDRQLEEALGKIADLEGDIDDARQERDQAKEQLTELAASEESHRRAVEELEGTREELQSALAEAQDELAQVLSENESREAELRRELEATVAGRGKLETDFEQQRQELEEQLAAAREAEGAARGDLEKARSQIGELEGELEKVRGALAESEKRAAALERKVSKSDKEVRTLRGKIEGLEGRPPESGGAAEGEAAQPSRGSRWLRAASLVAVGLVVGVLAVGPGGRLLRVDSVGSPTDREGQPEVLEESAGAPAGEEPGATGGAGAGALSQQAAGESADGAAIETPAQPVVGEAAVEAAHPSVAEVVEAWATAWSEQRVDDYLGYYASNFQTPNAVPRRAWEAYRRERLLAPATIEVRVYDLVASDSGGDRTTVVFEQAYRADSYSDRVRKTLVMVRETDAWKILSETSEGL